MCCLELTASVCCHSVEERRQQWTKAILSSEVHWLYYNNQDR